MADILSLASLFVCFIAILLAMRFLGHAGLYVVSVVIAICTNVQMLKVTEYALWYEPLAMGTVIFAATFAIDSILSEYYGKKVAQRGVYIGFSAYTFFALQMYLCIQHPASSEGDIRYAQAIELLFRPSFWLLLSSLCSYLCGQMCDVQIYSFLKQRGVVHHVWLRAFIAMCVANFVDNAIFSVMAWKVFCVQEVSWHALWHTYIWGTYVFRVIIAILCVPIVRLAGYMHNDRRDNTRIDTENTELR